MTFIAEDVDILAFVLNVPNLALCARMHTLHFVIFLFLSLGLPVAKTGLCFVSLYLE